MRYIASLLVAIVAAGCIGDTTVQVADGVAGAVQGQVLDQDGTPVVGPGVSVNLLSAPVNNQSRLLGTASFAANEQGRFAVGFVVDEEPQDALLVISITPPPGTGLNGKDSTGIVVKLERRNPPIDTTYVELRLTPRSTGPAH